MPTLRPRKPKEPKKQEPEEDVDPESPVPSDPPTPPPKAEKKERKPRTSRKSSVKEEKPNIVTIDDDSKSLKEELEEVFYELNEKELKEVNNAFDMNCSEDGNELLEGDDLKTALRSLGYEPRADEIKKLIKEHANKNGKINRSGFQKIMAIKIGTSPGNQDDMKDAISKVFNLLDLNRTGYITFENLKSISKELNEEITDEELNEMMLEADEDGDYKINKDEFCKIMKKTSLY